jgi:hypothetical protein
MLILVTFYSILFDLRLIFSKIRYGSLPYLSPIIMKLMTQQLEKRFQEIGQQLHAKDPTIVCKFFTPWSNRTWYVSERYPDDKVCYGYVVGYEAER